MSELRGQITDVLQRVKYVKLGGDLDPLAGDILALVAEAMLSEEAVEAARNAGEVIPVGPDNTMVPLHNGVAALTDALAAAGVTGAGQEGGEGE